MVELTVKLSSKGQVVIPKIFRETYKLYPLQEAIIKADSNGILIRKSEGNIAEKLKEIAKKKPLKKPLTAKEIKNLIEEQYIERARKAGIAI